MKFKRQNLFYSKVWLVLGCLIAVAHGEGRVKFGNNQAVDSLYDNKQITLRYVDNNGNATQNYPANPNGSIDGITGICSDDGRITMMMPHPERFYRGVQNSWTRDLDEDGHETNIL